jgi:hypothetical protein
MIRNILAISLFGLAVVMTQASAAQTTLWVDKDKPGDDSFLGTQANPYATISKALAVVNAGSGAYVIKIVEGDYTQAHEITFAGGGYPMEVSHANVSFVGVDASGNRPDPADYPRLGGDLNDDSSTTSALFAVVADGEDLGEVKLRQLRFVGEDYEDEDAPHAVFAAAQSGGMVSVVLDSCVIERMAMNGGVYSRPSVLAVSGAGTLHLKAIACEFVPSPAGGIKLTLGSDCVDAFTAAEMFLEVNNCSFVLTGTNAAESAIDNLLVADGEPRAAVSHFVVHDNLIDSRLANGETAGFAHGVLVGAQAGGASEEEGASLQFAHDSGATLMSSNDVMGCRSEAIKIVADQRQYGYVEVEIWHIDRNKIVENVGDGLVFDAGDSAAYFRCETQNNLIANNQNGLIVVDGDNLVGGALAFFYDTIANNDEFGVKIEAPEGFITNWANSVNYGNGSGSFPGSGWSPTDVASGGWQTNDWYGYGTYFDPVFVDDENGDYHIASTSGCRNAGTNSPHSGYTTALTGPDFYGGRRIAESTTDIGCDEYDP